MAELNSTDGNKYSRIDELREKIDECDSAIIEQMIQRSIISQKIGEIKSENGLDKIDRYRENDIRNRYLQLGTIGLSIADLVLELGRGKILD